jgi:hypothetical protein
MNSYLRNKVLVNVQAFEKKGIPEVNVLYKVCLKHLFNAKAMVILKMLKNFIN